MPDGAAVSTRLGQLTPVFVEIQTGNQLAPELEKAHGGLLDDPRLTEYVDFVGRKNLLPHSPRADFPHTFKVLRSEKIINAFALGNGNVYVTRGTLNLLDDEAELAEVVGHEVGHVAHRHIGKRIDQILGTTLLLSVAEAFLKSRKGERLSKRDQEYVDAANKVIPSVVLNGFGREQELESDTSGLEYMVKAGYDPLGSVRVFQKFQALEPEVKGLEIYFQSHPTAKRRIADLRKEIEGKYPGIVGDAHKDRYQAIVKGGQSLAEFSGEVHAGVPTPVYIAGGVVLVGVAFAVLLSL